MLPPAVQAAQRPGMESGRVPSTATLQLQYEHLNAWMWLLWGVITVLAGFYVVILKQPGFGTATNFIEAFFRGLTVQLAGQQITPATTAKAVGITLPT
jgi:hypothetical protein